jgi:hypothetical protein
VGIVLVARPSQILALILATLGVNASAAQARSPLVAIQPIRGAPDLVAASLRSQIARLVRARGFRVITTIPSVESAAEYAALSRARHVTTFVASDLEWSKSRQRLTIVVWNGEQGAELGRWSASAPVNNPGTFLASGFWKHLGPALEKARAPEPPVSPPVRSRARSRRR